MAGYSKIYCIGEDGFDGINPIYFQVWQGEGNRQWLEVHYFKEGLKPLGNIKSFVPQGPDMPDNLLDACIVFFPERFKKCPSFPVIEKKLAGGKGLDFDLYPGFPKGWEKLREEARTYYKDITIYEATLVVKQAPPSGW